MEFIKDFKNISKKDVAIAGGKGASLGEMTQAGIPVPGGFVILSDAFERFIEETDLDVELDSILDRVNYEEMHTVENASEEIKALVLNAKMPKDIAEDIVKNFKKMKAKFVAVRSSATSEDSSTAAWAGQLESYLNTTDKTLLENVKRCWASLFTPRAIFYRKEKNLHKSKISVAVVVQKMVESEESGIAFSVHPVTQDENQIIIEGGFGLGEAIVSGQITPDSYVVEKSPRRIIDKNVVVQERGLYRISKGGNDWKTLSKEIGERQVLSDKEILELTNLILKIEKHYNFPCDIEWAREKDKFYILQSRPITTLTDKTKKENNKIKLSKIYSREHSLFYMYIWNKDNRELSEELFLTNINNVVIIREPSSKKASAWYDREEIDNDFERLCEKLRIDKHHFELIKKRFYQYFKHLLPYLSKKKKIRNIRELKEYYENWLRWWSPMTNAMEIPNITGMPKIVKEESIKIRESTQNYSDYIDDLFIGFFVENYPKYKKYASFILPEEVFILEKRDLTKKEIANIEKRLNGYALVNSRLVLYEDLSKELERDNLELEELQINSKTNEIKGNSAYLGKVKGIVKLVPYKEDIVEVKEGEIIVTEMTTPDFVPAVKKAAAIVTDEGGITCHAAIVARELKKPCIIGTKIATKVLKDGDLVEVDADKGIVKILKKAQ